MRYVRMLENGKVFDLADGSLDVNSPNDNGAWSAEALLDFIEYITDTEGKVTLVPCDDEMPKEEEE